MSQQYSATTRRLVALFSACAFTLLTVATIQYEIAERQVAALLGTI